MLGTTEVGSDIGRMARDDSFHTLTEAAFPHRSDDAAGDDLIATTPPTAITGRADCCPANAVVRVVLPTAHPRAARAQLLLCAHHYRASQVHLAQEGASVFDAADRLICDGDSGVPADLWPPV